MSGCIETTIVKGIGCWCWLRSHNKQNSKVRSK